MSSRYGYGKINKPEILAPAGTFEAVKAAVKAGADAVYLGGDLFSARAFAGNFTEEKLIEAIEYCHLFGVKVYMAVNTLLKEKEICGDNLVNYIEPYYHKGVDGIIVQDVGVAAVLKNAFPDLPLHGSTQMSISSSYGAKLLRDFGFTRVVPARELSLAEIQTIKENVKIEIETFVHGAMCFSYSGKCLLSSFSGGRSGNRGRCAQPCRQCYEIFNTGEDENGPSVREYIMSLKDMCTLEILPELMDAGINSFKIEGRMKKPEYVAATVNAYKKARDFYIEQRLEFSKFDKYADVIYEQSHFDFINWSETDKQRYYDFVAPLIDELKDIYNRGGFHTGYYKTDKGNIMFASKRPNHEGIKVGVVQGVKGPDVKIRLEKDVNPGDVLEIRAKEKPHVNGQGKGNLKDETCIEITCNVSGKSGETITLKGKELRKINPSMDVFRTRNNDLINRINREILEPEKTIDASAFILARVGKPLSITIVGKKQGVSATVTGNAVSMATNNPTTEEQLLGKIKKTGGTGIVLDATCDIDTNSFVSMSEFNDLRRRAVEEFKQKIISKYYR